VDEIKTLHESFYFNIEIDEHIDSESKLTIYGNEKLLRLAINNLIDNCIQYSTDKKGFIRIYNLKNTLCVEFHNNGPTIIQNEKQFIFQHFFRGQNSNGKRGFGLGLVFVYKIVELHKGKVEYLSPAGLINVFRLSFSLS
jgi:signal transduction histidine kinase